MFGRFKISAKRKRPLKPKNTQYLTHKEAARALMHDRLHYFNQFYQVTYNRVAIKDQRRCWGSCSSKGNLNFSYKLLFLPPCLRDYVILHELCHLRVLNHSIHFWNEMALVMPDYEMRAQMLRTIERTHGTSLRALKKVSENHDCVHCSSALVTSVPSMMKETVGTDVLIAY